jgi:hypothetical protein
LNPEITHASDKTSRFGMAHESQSLEVGILESPATAENKARLSALARRAGGPRTPKGKARSRHNALKHGLFSKVVLLKDEPRAELNSLLNGLRNDLQPVGTLENVFVDRLATVLWRYRRMLIAEGQQLEKGREVLRMIEPDMMHMDLVLRYGPSLERELERTLKQFEWVRRIRLGQPLPPPIDLNVSLEE